MIKLCRGQRFFIATHRHALSLKNCTQRSGSRAISNSRGATEYRIKNINKASLSYESKNHKLTAMQAKNKKKSYFPPPACCVSLLLNTRPSAPSLFWNPAGNSVCQVIKQGSRMYHLDEIKLIVFLLKLALLQRKVIHQLTYSPSSSRKKKKKSLFISDNI